MDVKARSRAMREILTRIVDRSNGAITVKVFGDKVILDEGLWHTDVRKEEACVDRPHRRRELATLRRSHILLFD
jgi:hypothetical protein